MIQLRSENQNGAAQSKQDQKYTRNQTKPAVQLEKASAKRYFFHEIV